MKKMGGENREKMGGTMVRFDFLVVFFNKKKLGNILTIIRLLFTGGKFSGHFSFLFSGFQGNFIFSKLSF